MLFAPASPVSSLSHLLGGQVGISPSLLVLGSLVLGCVYVWSALARAALFRRRGERAWRAWVPILRTGPLLRRGGLPPALAWVSLVPFGFLATHVILVIAASRIHARLGYARTMTVLAVIAFPVWESVLGFGAAGDAPQRDISRPRMIPSEDDSVPLYSETAHEQGWATEIDDVSAIRVGRYSPEIASALARAAPPDDLVRVVSTGRSAAQTPSAPDLSRDTYRVEKRVRG